MHAYRLSTCIPSRLVAALEDSIFKPRLVLYSADARKMHTSGDERGHTTTTYYKLSALQWTMGDGVWRLERRPIGWSSEEKPGGLLLHFVLSGCASPLLGKSFGLLVVEGLV